MICKVQGFAVKYSDSFLLTQTSNATTDNNWRILLFFCHITLFFCLTVEPKFRKTVMILRTWTAFMASTQLASYTTFLQLTL